MTSKKKFRGIFCVALVLGFVLTGCPTEPSKGETWANVDDFSQFDGTWKGSFRKTITAKEFIESLGMTWDTSMQFMLGDMRITNSGDITLVVDTTEMTSSMISIITQAFSGENINLFWPMLRDEMLASEGELEGMVITINDENHSVTMEMNQPETEITENMMASMLASGMEINEVGTKLRMPADSINEAVSAIIPEIILIKQ